MKPSLLFPEPNKLYNLVCDTLDLASMVSEIDDLIRFEDQLTYEDPNKEYRGQTVLHIAIARGEFFLIQKILKAIKSLGFGASVFQMCYRELSKLPLLLGETPLASALHRRNHKRRDRTFFPYSSKMVQIYARQTQRVIQFFIPLSEFPP